MFWSTCICIYNVCMQSYLVSKGVSHSSVAGDKVREERAIRESFPPHSHGLQHACVSEG